MDEHAFHRKGIAVTISAKPDMKPVAEASNGEVDRKQIYSEKLYP